MSINTDLASIEIIASLYRGQDLREAYLELVHKLQEKVTYFDWVGLYLKQGEEMVLEAASDMGDPLTWECNSELRIPIKDTKELELGKIVVRSQQPICFDITDVSTLRSVAEVLSQKLSLN
jgi:putative methionine-R-sulfoxide reductase with GAF domain